MRYALLDRVRIDGQLTHIQTIAPLLLPMYRAPEDAQQEESAPVLIGYESGDAFGQWFGQSSGDAVGISIESEAGPEAVQKHLRRFLMVQFEGDNRPVYFRYYDPAILRVFLPTCTETELQTLFGPIQAFWTEGEEPGRWLRFTHQNGQLVRQETGTI